MTLQIEITLKVDWAGSSDIFFIFPPFPRDGGRKRSEGRGTLSKIRGNRGEKGGRGGGVDAGKGSGAFFLGGGGGGVLNIYFEG